MNDDRVMSITVETGELDSLWVQQPVLAIIVNFFVSFGLLFSTGLSLWQHNVFMISVSCFTLVAWRTFGKYRILGFPKITARHSDLED